MSGRAEPLRTPDGRYLIVRGQLWRASDPSLDPAERQGLVDELMRARRAVRDAADDTARRAARDRVDAAKRGLGERGPVWWDDDAPDYTRHAVHTTPYADWYAGQAILAE